MSLVDPVIGQMEAARADYDRASQIRASFLGLSSAPWLFLGIGLLLIGTGGYVLARPSARSVAAVGLVGLGILVAPLVLGIPGKVDAAVRVTRLGEVGLALATGQKAVGATALFDGMASDVRTKLEPAIASALGQTSAEGQAAFAKAFPSLATWVDSWEGGISAQSHALSDGQVALSPVFASANKIPLRPIPWLFIVPGLVLVALAGSTLVPAQRLEPAPVHDVVPTA